MINRIIELDKFCFLFLNNLGSEYWDPFWMFISDRTWMFLLITPVLIYYIIKYDGKQAWLSLVFFIICISLTDLIHVHFFKNCFMRLRPCWDPQISDLCRVVVDKGGLYGFVSGHAANTTAIVVFFLLSYRKRV